MELNPHRLGAANYKGSVGERGQLGFVKVELTGRENYKVRCGNLNKTSLPNDTRLARYDMMLNVFSQLQTQFQFYKV